MSTGRYQEFDPLTPEEFAALERSILDGGVQVAISSTSTGTCSLGTTASRSAKDTKSTDFRRLSRPGSSRGRKATLRPIFNMARRSLSARKVQGSRSGIDSNGAPSIADRLIAQALGVDHKTVGRVRANRSHHGEVPQVGAARSDLMACNTKRPTSQNRPTQTVGKFPSDLNGSSPRGRSTHRWRTSSLT